MPAPRCQRCAPTFVPAVIDNDLTFGGRHWQLTLCAAHADTFALMLTGWVGRGRRVLPARLIDGGPEVPLGRRTVHTLTLAGRGAGRAPSEEDVERR